MADSGEDLLPESYAEFRSERYWDRFFEKRRGKAFEWYGEWRQIRPALERIFGREVSILMVGCGNSELSAEMYDDGYKNITNIDFNKRVIMDMMTKNLRKRPEMKWQVGDITNMKYNDESFDVVLDKGALDALMGDDSPESTETGFRFLRETYRVLSPTGVYICVSLLQEHVYKTTLGVPWNVRVDSVTPAPDMAMAELQPLLLVANKKGEEPFKSEISFVTSRVVRNMAQLDAVVEISRHRRDYSRWEAAAASEAADVSFEKQFADVRPGRFVAFDLDVRYKRIDDAAESKPYFYVTILDSKTETLRHPYHRCCIFLVPQAERVIVVAMPRHQSFSNLKDVKSRVSAATRPYLPDDVKGIDGVVPIFALGEGVGSRRVLTEITSDVSGPISVEDVTVEEQGESKTLRRLVILSNRGLIQSEAQVIKSEEKEEDRLDPIEHQTLCMAYHHNITAAAQIAAAAGADGVPSAVVVGLGGGGLPVFLWKYLGFRVQVVELDPTMKTLAGKYFNCEEQEGFKIHIDDGIDFISRLAEENPNSKTLLVIDAGSADASLEISCPPPPFLELSFLEKMAGAVSDNGLVAVNFVSRSQEALKKTLSVFKSAFPHVKISAADDDVNKVLVASRRPIGIVDAAAAASRVRAASMAMPGTPQLRDEDIDLLVDTMMTVSFD